MNARARTVVLASRNPDKVREMRALCAGLPFAIRSSADYPGLPEVVEDGTTILGNATRKALVTAAYTGEIAVADDTALTVQALNGLPDVFASRFAGPDASYADNCALLAELMHDVPDGFRQAAFQTAAVWCDPRPGDRRPGSGGPGTQLRWVHAPFQRSVHVADLGEDETYWSTLRDRAAVWAEYRALHAAPGVVAGVAQSRTAALVASLCAGGEHPNVPEGAMRLPDPRIWTARGPDDATPPTQVSPAGLPPDAPGRAVDEPVWLEISAVGRLLGEITRAPAGTRGFGYDPLFRPVGTSRTLAELGPDEKNAASHRGRALRRLLDAAGAVYAARA